jgi:hypothetical protein
MACSVQTWALLLAAAVAAPALSLAQEAPSSSVPVTSAPVTSAPAGGVPAAELPGASLPGIAPTIPGLTGAALGLAPMPPDYTRYGASVGVGASDNINLTATDPKSQALAATNLFFDLIRSGSRLQLSALGNFSDINYLEHAYNNQVLGRFDGTGNLTLWQHHLTWLVRDDYGDSQIDPLQALTPTNLQRVNVFTTGPTLMMQPTVSSFVELQGLYSRNTYQNSPFSGNSETGSLTVGHQMSPSSSISFIGRVQQERFDNTIVNTNYQVREYYGDYNLKGARTSIDAQGGLAQANDAGSWKSSPLARLSLTRSTSEFSSVSLSGGRDYVNAMGSFAALGAGTTGGVPVGPVAQTTANALHTYGNANWRFSRLRTTVALFGAWERDAYDRQSQFDFSRSDFGFSLGRQLTPRLSANITGTTDRSQYLDQGFTDNYNTVGGGVVYRPGAWVVIYGRYDHAFRRPSGDKSNGLGFDENRVYIMIGYYPHSSGTGISGESGMGGFP